MERKRTISTDSMAEDQVVEFKGGLARIKWELVLFLVNIAVLCWLPRLGVLLPSRAAEDLVFKGLLVNAGALHAHGMRKALFPYIDFANEKDTASKVLVIVLYAVVIIAYARGG